MWELVVRRLRKLRAVLDRPWVKFIGAVWALGAIYDQIGAQFVPASWSERWPRFYELLLMPTGLLPLWAWALLGLVIIIAALTEHLVRRDGEDSKQAQAKDESIGHEEPFRARLDQVYEAIFRAMPTDLNSDQRLAKFDSESGKLHDALSSQGSDFFAYGRPIHKNWVDDFVGTH